MKPKSKKEEASPSESRPAPRHVEPPKSQPDFAELDLTVEEIEERVHPSETNVFDK